METTAAYNLAIKRAEKKHWHLVWTAVSKRLGLKYKVEGELPKWMNPTKAELDMIDMNLPENRWKLVRLRNEAAKAAASQA